MNRANTLSKLARAAVALFMAAVLLAACRAPQDPPAEFAFVGVNVVDVETGEIAPNQTVLISGGKILTVAPFADVIVENRVNAVFAQDQFLIPGLMDSHVHAFADIETATQHTLPLFIANGITHIRDTGTTLNNLEQIATRLNNNPALAHPDYFSTGPILDSVKLPWYGSLQKIIETENEVAEVLDQLQAANISQLKAYSNLQPDVYRALAREGHARGLSLVGHLPRNIAIVDAAKAEQLTIEHLEVSSTVSCAPTSRDWYDDSIKVKFSEGQGAYLGFMHEYWQSLDWDQCRQQWQAYAESGGYLTPTLVMETTDRALTGDRALKFLTPGARAWCETGLQAMDDNPDQRRAASQGLEQTLSAIRSAGVPLLAGSDTPNNCLVPGYSLHWELQRLVDFGLTPLEALQTATTNPAVAFTGSPRLVRRGHTASLVLLSNNPLEDIAALSTIEGVYHDGRWWNKTALSELNVKAQEFVNRAEKSL